MTLPIDTGSIGSGSNIENEGSVENIGATAQPQQPSTEQTAETVELIVNETNPFRDGDDGVFEAVCLFEEDAPIPETHEVATTYVNGSNQTLPEAQCEGLYLSEVRGGPVRMIYNPGGGGCSRISRRPHFSHDHPLCQALLDYLHTFFTHPTNEGRRHTIIFYGDGGAVVQAVLEHSPYVDLIDVVGIAPTVYVTTGNTRHFRVSGDMTTLFDRTGFSQTNVTTLPYSSGAEGVFFPSIRCPSYQWALRMTALQTGDVQEENEEESGGGGVGLHEIALVEIGTGNAMNRLTRTLAAGDSSAEAEFNPVPSNCRDILIATLFSIFRTSALVQEVLIISVTDQPDVFVTYVLVSGYSLNWLRYFFLFFTNSRCLRDRCRRVRLFARAFEPVFLTLISLDCGNCVRRYGRSPAILPPIFVTASTITGSILFFEGTRNLFRGLRGRVQRCLARRLNAPEEQRAIVRRPDGNRIGAIQGLMAGMHFGYLCFAVGVLNQILIQTPRLTSRANSTEDSGVYSHQLANASYAWGSGDMLGVSQTINFCFCMIVAAVNVILMVGLFQRNRRRQ